MTIMRGDAYAVPVELTQDGYALTPDMVNDVEITVGDVLTRNYSAGDVVYDEELQQWFFRLTQAETLAMEADESYQVIARVKYTNDPADVKGVKCGFIIVEDTNSTEVI